MKLRSVSLALAVAATLAQSPNPFEVTTNAQGGFSVAVPSWDGFALDSASDIGVQVNGTWLRAGAGLSPSGFVSFAGSDSWGDYNATSVTWLGADSQPLMLTIVAVYLETPAVVFEQYFPASIATGGTVQTKDDVVSAFPSFVLPENSTNVGVMQWLGPFIDNGSRQPIFGTFSGASYAGGVEGGPLLLFDASGAHAATLSSLSQFMAGSTVKSSESSLRVGVMGSIDVIPAGGAPLLPPLHLYLTHPLPGPQAFRTSPSCTTARVPMQRRWRGATRSCGATASITRAPVLISRTRTSSTTRVCCGVPLRL